jgi:hypothetical protein
LSEKIKDARITLETATLTVTGHCPTVWTADDFAASWYKDALAEARARGEDARRREIIFAACFAECFIFEWARHKVGLDIIHYFSPDKGHPAYRRPLRTKWEQVPKELHAAKVISVCPKLHLRRLDNLSGYRNGLLHAATSLPAINPQPEATQPPYPTRRRLMSLQPGYAVNVVYDLVSQLCDQTSEEKPPYLERIK